MTSKTTPTDANGIAGETRTYPREWFKITRWSKEPMSEKIQRETKACLFTEKGRRLNKSTSWEDWFPTREEAQAVIDKRLAREADAYALRRVQLAGGELLETLQRAVEIIDDQLGGDFPELLQEARAAISKATRDNVGGV